MQIRSPTLCGRRVPEEPTGAIVYVGPNPSPLLRRANTIGATAMETFLQPRFSPRSSPLSTTRRTGGEPRQGSSLRGRSNSAHDHVLDRSLGLL